jgi:Helix-turn-helix domain
MPSAFGKLIRDDELDRSHLKVLANLWEHFNATTWTAWPSRELIAQQEGLDVKSVNNNLYDLRRRGYMIGVAYQTPRGHGARFSTTGG